MDGGTIACAVIHVQRSDQKRPTPDSVSETTFWIDKARQTIVKTFEHAHTYLLSGASHIPLEQDITTVFPATELDTPVDDHLFTFIPPTDANLLPDFPDPRQDTGAASLTGYQAPPLQLRSADGKTVSLASFQGRPVLLDLWATWCGPCVDALPQLARIYAEAKAGGLVLLTVDQDEDPHTATGFLARKGYTWPNFHDSDGAIEALVGSSPIPRTILIDAAGKITYDASGTDEIALRTAIAHLGPDFAALAPKPKLAPSPPLR